MTPLGENSCGSPHVPSLPAVRISELGLAGSGAGGFVELQGPPGTSLDGLSLVIFTSQEGAAHGSVPLGGNLSASGLLLLGDRNGETGLGENLHSSSDGSVTSVFSPSAILLCVFQCLFFHWGSAKRGRWEGWVLGLGALGDAGPLGLVEPAPSAAAISHWPCHSIALAHLPVLFFVGGGFVCLVLSVCVLFTLNSGWPACRELYVSEEPWAFQK